MADVHQDSKFTVVPCPHRIAHRQYLLCLRLEQLSARAGISNQGDDKTLNVDNLSFCLVSPLQADNTCTWHFGHLNQ